MSVSSAAVAFGTDVLALDLARFVQGFGGSCSWAAALPWLASTSPLERRGEVIGSALGIAIAGLLLGPVVGGAATVVGPQLIFTLAAVANAGLVWLTALAAVFAHCCA